MSHPDAPDDQEAAELETVDEDEGELLVVDPEDYHKSQRLKQINEARREVLKVRRDKRNNIETYEEFQGKWYENYHLHLAEAVATYGHEVLPILMESDIDEDEFIIDSLSRFDIRDFIYTDGRTKIKDGDDTRRPQAPDIMLVYRRLDHLLHRIGLGLELEAGSDEWEV